jgi:DNA-binding NarL/FixJ family response regulator
MSTTISLGEPFVPATPAPEAEDPPRSAGRFKTDGDSRPPHTGSDSPIPMDPLWRTAQSALAESGVLPDDEALWRTWQDLASGHFMFARERVGGGCVDMILRAAKAPRTLGTVEASIALRVFCGELQKTIAAEMCAAPSTVSSHFVRVLLKLGLTGRPVALPVPLAALTIAGIARVARARRTAFDHQGSRYVVVSVPRPNTQVLDALTKAEQDVAHGLIEGRTREEIAALRSRKPNTVSRQCNSIFGALSVTGRYALIGRAAELQCFR